MTEHSAIEAATRRLQAALDTLEAALERRREADRRSAGLERQVQALDMDRARLASELDGAAARAKELERVNRDVAGRLDIAMESIRAVIAAQGE